MTDTPCPTTPIKLPEPKFEGEISVEAAIKSRRSRRVFGSRALTMNELSQILWSGLGITGKKAHSKASPSAGAQHPLNLFFAARDGAIENLAEGFYQYFEADHHIEKLSDTNFIPRIGQLSWNQGCVKDAPVILVITVEYSRTMSRYGERGVRYAHMDIGHLGENIYLQAEAMDLSTVGVGAFEDDQLREMLPLPPYYEVRYIMPLGPRK